MMAYLTTARDAVITILVILIAWWVYHAGQDQAQMAQVTELKSIINQNAATTQKWQKESSDAWDKYRKDLDTLRPAIVNNTKPVLLQVRASRCGVPVPGKAAGNLTGGGAADPGSGSDSGSVDVRPPINAFELKYEADFATCRRVLDSWPTE